MPAMETGGRRPASLGALVVLVLSLAKTPVSPGSLANPEPVYNGPMDAVTIPCGICQSTIAMGAVTCPGCGRPVTDQDRAVLQIRFEGADWQAHERGKQVRAGAKWVGVLAILFAVSAPIMFAMQEATTTNEAMTNLAKFQDDDVLQPINGKVYTAGELRRLVEREPYQVLVVNGILAVLMGVLWLWARRAPLPAIACALALYLVVQVVSAILDPSSIVKGIIIKLFAFGALYKGFKAALDARAAIQQQRPGV